MFRYNTKAKIPLNNEQTPKFQKDKNNKQVMLREGTNRRERVKEGNKEGEYG
jgi:hypothetical protein